MSYDPDLSGVNWSYYVTNYQRTIFKYNQKILFEVPVFQNDRLEIIRLGTVNQKLQVGSDYAVYEDDVDYDAISVCKNIDPNFSATLLKSVTLVVNVTSPFKIQAKFNQLFADVINYARINQAQEIEVTPVLIANMVEQISYLQQMILDQANSYSAQSSITKMALNEYPDGDNNENLITDELHDIDTINGKCLIRTIYGSFFKDSVIVKNELTDAVFIPGVDYQIIDLDISRTKVTANASGVYRIIKILKSFVGGVKVTYRAYGGEADVASIRMVQDRVKVIEEFLSRTSYITPSTIAADPTVVLIQNKLQELEGTMRLLLQNGLPSYGDVTTGTAVVKKITAQDSGLHWWTIATLYRVDGSVDDVIADVFRFRLKTMLSKMMFECIVAVNADGDADKRLDITCMNSNVPNNTLDKFCPKLRILEVNAGGVYSGIVLQLGMKLGSGILQETFDIEDMSGRESCWKLVAFSATSSPPEDTGVLMPNGQLTFTYGDATAKVDAQIIPLSSGLNVFIPELNLPLAVGNFSSNQVGTTANYDKVVDALGDVELSVVKAFSMTVIVDIGTNGQKTVEFIVPVTSRDETLKQWTGQSYINAVFGRYDMRVRIWIDANNKKYVGFDVMSDNLTTTLNVTAVKLLF